MRRFLFEKAKILKDIEILSETEHSIRIRVGEYEVVLKYQNHKIIWLCTCKHSSLQNSICSHVIAAFKYL